MYNNSNGKVLYNGIQLSEKWPPRNIDINSRQPIQVPYLKEIPGVIPIDIGRQLFIDEFLIEKTTMTRKFHKPVKYPGNPVIFPQSEDELNPDFPPCAISKCGGVWFDDQDSRFKMWYMAGYLGAMVYAESSDGVHWERPELDVVERTNLILPRNIHPDSGTVWIDKETNNENERYKMMIREPNTPSTGGLFYALLFTSGDGIHWQQVGKTGPMGDRSTFFYNPFRTKWVYSIRSSCENGRARSYWESEDFIEGANWEDGQLVPWSRADCMDEAGDILPQLYNLDAVPYESIILGFHQILKGPPNYIGEKRGLPKLTELTVSFSRDGFHWHRPQRKAFISARREPGSWEYGYIESSGGVCLVVGDELWFYYSAYAGDSDRITDDWHTNGTYANGAVGLAKLRRDGFASMQARIPDAKLLTRPLTFTKNKLFVNINTAGSQLRVEVLDEKGEIIPGFSAEDCVPLIDNSTCQEVCWQESRLEDIDNKPVRFRFIMDRGEIYSFWVSNSSNGVSGGYVGAGGPGFSGEKDS